MRRSGLLLCMALVLQACAARIAEEKPAILQSGSAWQRLGEGFQLTADSAVDESGGVYFTDARRNRIWKIDSTGVIMIWKENTGGAHGIAMAPDGRLYAGQHARKRIVAYSPDGSESVLADGVQTHHLIVSRRNEVYYTDGPNHTIWLLNAAGSASGQRREVTTEIFWPHGLRMDAGRSVLIVTDSQKGNVWSIPIQPDGSLGKGSGFCRLRTSGQPSDIDPGGVAFDTQGDAYIATNLGVQVCDAHGNVSEVIQTPGDEGVSDVFFAGANFEWLYVTDGDRIYRRHVNRRGLPRRG